MRLLSSFVYVFVWLCWRLSRRAWRAVSWRGVRRGAFVLLFVVWAVRMYAIAGTDVRPAYNLDATCDLLARLAAERVGSPQWIEEVRVSQEVYEKYREQRPVFTPMPCSSPSEGLL